MWGLEFEASYRTDDVHFLFSHSYTELQDGRLVDTEFVQGVSAWPYDDVVPGQPFGRHLANWSPHLTKLFAVRDLNECWTASGSLRAYWGFPGAKELTAYNAFLFASEGKPSPSLGLTDPGFDKSFRGSCFVDLGLERKILCGRGVIRLDLYNVLGWFDIDLNKRNYLNRLSEYRSEAAAIAVSARLK
jgi:iron complex outermembrane receptor protein